MPDDPSSSGAGDDVENDPSGMLSPEAFWREFEAIRPRLWLIAAAILRNPADADDVVQDAALIGLRRRDSFTVGTSFAAWMGQVTRLTALGNRRSSQAPARRATGQIEDFMATARHDTARHVARADANSSAATRLTAALAHLSETERTCLLLRIVGGLNYESISEVLSIPKGTAMSHVSRARVALRG
ncbi:MAG: RNA polymerase sigma factor, partial [Phycisphaerales bacterium]|nr:RNA polymerase sigma factor [Phycisphaerales bacterium]